MTLDPNLVPPPAPPPAPAPAVASSRSGKSIWLLELVPLAVGIVLGREIAYEGSIPGNEFAGLGPFLVGLFLCAILAVVWVVLLLTRRGRAAGFAFVAIVAMVGGAYGTVQVATMLGSTAGPIGLTYQPPVVINSIGTTQVSLTGVLDFNGSPDNGASCSSMADSTVIGQVQTLSAGKLAGGHLRATLTLDNLGNGEISMWIDGADVPAGEMQPTWDGPVTLRGATTGNVAGDADFTNAAQPPTDPGKGPASSGGTWPSTLSGSLHWTCRP